MPKYTVGAGLFGIYAGVLKNEKEWKDKTECTNQAIEAVRDYMYEECIAHKETSGGYQWTRKDGSVVELMLLIKSKSREEQETEILRRSMESSQIRTDPEAAREFLSNLSMYDENGQLIDDE